MKYTPRIQTLLALLGFVIVVAVVFGGALFPSEKMLLFGDDIHHYSYYVRRFLLSWFRKGVIPWWNPYQFSGYPFLANPQSVNPWYPASWMFFVLPFSFAFSWYVALHLIIAMTGMYWLLRRWVDSVSAWSCGIIYGLSGFFAARIYSGHWDIIASASYLPWVFGCWWIMGTSRSKKGHGKHIVIAASVLALQLLTGYQTIVLLTLEAAGIAMLVLYLRYRSFVPLRNAVIALALGAALAGVQVIPSFEFFRQTVRTFPLVYEWTSYGASTVQSIVRQLFQPFYFGDQYSYWGPPQNYGEHAMFMGISGLALAVLGVIWGISGMGGIGKKRDIRDMRGAAGIVFIAIACFGLWVSLAHNAPWNIHDILWRVIPMYHSLRQPSRHLLLSVFGMSVLSGIGLFAVKRIWMRVVIAVILLIELVPFARHFIAIRDIPKIRHDPTLVAILKSDRELYRFLPNFGVWIPPRDSLDFNAPMEYGIFSSTGYDPLILRNYYEFIDAASGNAESSIMNINVQVPYLKLATRYVDFLNIKYVLVSPQYDPLGGVSGDHYRLVREDTERHYRLYENLSVLPRFFFAGEAKGYPDRASVAFAIQSGKEDPSKTVLLLEGDVQRTADTLTCDGGERSTVSVSSYNTNSIYLSVDASCNGYVVSSEVMYPGWEAYLDGEKVPLYTGNLAFRTMYVPKGKHSIIMRYNPRIFLYGALVTLATVFVCAVMWRKWSIVVF
ncbi:YfhO family protein [Patescibacteria group bacterium]|nr:YfhO family protein [Patescibacteria group bacterium]